MSRKAIIYTRVSTDEQKDRGFSLNEQESRLKKYCERENIEIVEHYQDDHSAKNFNRPEFQRMLFDLKQKRIKAELFICIRMDRFSRNVHESLNMIQKLRSYGLELKLIEGDYDLSIPENLIPFMINIVIPQVENERRGLNTKRGMRQANREGRHTGLAPKGYKNVRIENRPMIIPNEDAQFVTEAFEVYSRDIHSRERVLNSLREKGFKCSKNQFGLMLRNPIYIGKIRIKEWKDEPEEIVDGLHKALISEETYNAVQLALENRKGVSKKWNTLDSRFPLRGHLKCRICGGNLTGSASKSRSGIKYNYYHCQHGCKERFQTEEAHRSFMEYLKGFKIKNEVMSLYYKIMEDIFSKDDSKRKEEIVDIKRKINHLELLNQKIVDKFVDNQIDNETFKNAKQRYTDQIKLLQQRKIEIDSTDSNFMQYVN